MSTQPTSHRKIALITGGSRGIGRSAALALAARGTHDLILTYHANEGAARETVGELEARGVRAAMLQLDVGASQRHERFAEALTETLRGWGRERVDALVNNGGIGGDNAPLSQVDEAQFDALLAVHFKGVLFLTQRLLPLIEDGGVILNVSSGLARFTFPGYGVYAAMKGAVEVMTRYLALELGGRGIRVNVIAPGPVATDFGGGRVRDNEAFKAALAERTALGRVAEPEDIGQAIAALLSDEMGFMTGQRVELSGGIML